MRFWFPDGHMGEWACLGAITDRSARVWLRNPDRGRRIARLMMGGRPVAEAELWPAPEHDYVAAADIALPAPTPSAPFAVEVGGMVRHGRLAPATGQAAGFAFAFGSCNEPFLSGPRGGPPLVVQPRAGIYPRMRDVLRQRDARFLLLLGDQIYSDHVPWFSVRQYVRRALQHPDWEEVRDIYRELYRGYFHQAGFRALLEGWPSYLTWDDHDIYDGYGSHLHGESGPFDQALFQAAEVAFREYQHLHNPGGSLSSQRPYHYHFWYGDAGFFVFDLRGERDYRHGNLLGARQWADLHAFLREADAREASTVFVGATIPIIHFAPAVADWTQWLPGDEGKGVRDRWTVDGYRPVRDEVLEALFTWQSARPRRQVIVLSGDVHAGAAFRVTRRGAGVLYQWTSSPLTTPAGLLHSAVNWLGSSLVNWGEREYQAEREALVAWAANFGLVELRALHGGGHEVTFTLFAYNTRSQQLRTAARVVACPGD